MEVMCLSTHHKCEKRPGFLDPPMPSLDPNRGLKFALLIVLSVSPAYTLSSELRLAWAPVSVHVRGDVSVPGRWRCGDLALTFSWEFLWGDLI